MRYPSELTAIFLRSTKRKQMNVLIQGQQCTIDYCKKKKVFTALKIQIEVFWVVTPCNDVDVSEAAWFSES